MHMNKARRWFGNALLITLVVAPISPPFVVGSSIAFSADGTNTTNPPAGLRNSTSIPGEVREEWHRAAQQQESSSTRNDSNASSPKPIVFYAMGDTPYRNMEMKNLREVMPNIPNDAHFVIHVGDVNAPAVHHCSAEWYSDVRDALLLSPHPVFVVPGDNDWVDCPDPDLAWMNFETNFVTLLEGGQSSLNASRQLGRVENFAFFIDRTLFVGLHVVRHDESDGSERRGTTPRLFADCARWAVENIHRYANTIDSLVIFGHEPPRVKGSSLRHVFGPIVDLVRSMNVPFLYLHGHGHRFEMEREDALGVPGMVRLQVDRGRVEGGVGVPPLRVAVHPRGRDGPVFEVDRRWPDDAVVPPEWKVVTYQAEYCARKRDADVATREGGYTGSGYVDFDDDGYVEWDNVTAIAGSGEYDLRVRYAVDDRRGRECALFINDADDDGGERLAFEDTGGYGRWQYETVTVSLRSGRNTVRIEALDEGPHIDKMEVILTLSGVPSKVKGVVDKSAAPPPPPVP